MDNLLEFPIQMSITGKTKSGKSYLLRNRILPRIIKEYQGVYILSPTSKLDDEWVKFRKQFSKKKREMIHLIDEFTNDDVLSLINMISVNKTLGSKEKYLIVADDITDLFSTSKKDFFSTLAFKGRHMGCSYIFTSHKWNAINTLTRNNLGTKIFFRISNEREHKTFLDDNVTRDFKGKLLNKMFDDCTSEYKSFVIKSTSDGEDFFCITRDGRLVKMEKDPYKTLYGKQKI